MNGATCVKLPRSTAPFAIGVRALAERQSYWTQVLPFPSWSGWVMNLTQSPWIDVQAVQPGPSCR